MLISPGTLTRLIGEDEVICFFYLASLGLSPVIRCYISDLVIVNDTDSTYAKHERDLAT